MSHTPAPWRLWLSEDDLGAFVLHGDSPAPHGKGMVIAQRNIGTPDGNEGIANACLIAAAPDLLAACKGVGIVLNSGAMRQFDGEPWIGRLRDAIEKAEGRS